MGISEFSGKPDETLQWTSIPPGGTSDAPILSAHYQLLYSVSMEHLLGRC